MDATRLKDRKAAALRALIACAASLAIHAVFFALLFAFTPGPPRALPQLEVNIQGDGSEARAVAGPRVAARPKLASEPKLSARGGGRPAASAGSITGDRAAEAAAAVPTAPAATEGASGGRAADSAPARDGFPGASGGATSALSSVKAGPMSDPGSALDSLGASAQSETATGDPVAALAARVNAAIEARKTYPEAAWRRGTAGTVRLKLEVAADGRLLSAKLAASSGSSLLDRAALELASSVFPVDNLAGRSLEFHILVRYSLKKQIGSP